jgi:hypothetical protein
MADFIQPRTTAPVAQPRQKPSVDSLRAEYDKVAAKVTEAYKSGDQAGGDKLRPQKLAAFAALREAYNTDRHAQLDRLRKKPV